MERMPTHDGIDRLLSDMLEDAKRPRTPREHAANHVAILGVGSLKDMIEAKRQARQEAASLSTRRSRP
jgi:hypothetical protein